jgi:predicted enzyme related to lactoylglutathione lyase
MLRFGSIMIGSLHPEVLGKFYEKVFGRPADWSEDGWSGWQSGDFGLMIGEHSEVQDKSREPQRVIFNFEAENTKEEYERIKALGVTVVKELYEMEGSWIATFADPDGNYFQVTSPWKSGQ